MIEVFPTEAAQALYAGQNRPLVYVLTEALATDRAARTGESNAAAKYQANAAIQNLLGYVKERNHPKTSSSSIRHNGLGMLKSVRN